MADFVEAVNKCRVHAGDLQRCKKWNIFVTVHWEEANTTSATLQTSSVVFAPSIPRENTDL